MPAQARQRADVEPVTFTDEATFRRERWKWLDDIKRQGDAQVLAVCFALSSYFGFKTGGMAWVDQHRLAADLNCNVRTVGRRIQDAVDRGWLITQRRANNTSVYRMSRSRSVLATVELEHENRMAEFTVESARRRLARDTYGSDSSVGTVQTDLSDTFGQPCPIGSDSSVGLSSVIPTEGDPRDQPTERLGEGVPDSREPADLEKSERNDLLAALGRGDLERGWAIAAELGEKRLAYLAHRAKRDGLTGAAAAISSASAQAARQISERMG